MNIRRAISKDIPMVNNLLIQVCNVHNEGRPDLFKHNCRKYNDDELERIFANPQTPVFVAVDEKDEVMGYAFCIFKQELNNNVLTDIKTIYIDDLCVDESRRGQHVGKTLYEYVLNYAKAEGCYNVTLNVWSCNEKAMRFYDSCGLKPQKIGMEVIL